MQIVVSAPSLCVCSRHRLAVALASSLDDVSELTREAAVHALPHEEEAEVAHQVVGEVQLRCYRLQRSNEKREQRWKGKLRYCQVNATDQNTHANRMRM